MNLKEFESKFEYLSECESEYADRVYDLVDRFQSVIGIAENSKELGLIYNALVVFSAEMLTVAKYPRDEMAKFCLLLEKNVEYKMEQMAKSSDTPEPQSES